jgi:hypothetical protein
MGLTVLVSLRRRYIGGAGCRAEADANASGALCSFVFRRFENVAAGAYGSRSFPILKKIYSSAHGSTERRRFIQRLVSGIRIFIQSNDEAHDRVGRALRKLSPLRILGVVMEKTAFTSGKLGLLIGALVLAVLVYQVLGRGCTVASISFDSGISFACAGDTVAEKTPSPPARVSTASTTTQAPAPSRPETQPAHASENTNAKPIALAGEWHNADAATRGLTRLVVGENPATVHAWGSCHPSDCDWGAVPASAFRQSVDGGSEAALQAHFKTGANETTLIITPVGDELRVETLTHFTDKSGRADYSVRDQFRRTGS